MSQPTLRLGSLPPIRLSTGTLLAVVVLAVIVQPTLMRAGLGAGTAIVLAVAVGVAMIASVLVHEMAHALVARAFGGTVDHIALTLWGGHTQYRGEGIGAAGSTLISLAGPASNLLLAGSAAGAAALIPDGGAGSLVLSLIGYLNLALAVFNLLPGLPMDGGRALESVLGAVLSSRTRGTRITAWIGRGIAVLVLVVPLWRLAGSELGTGTLLTVLWAVLIASLLWQGATRALQGAQVQDRVEVLDARGLAQRLPLLPAEQPVAALDRMPAGPGQVLVVAAPTAPGAHPQVMLPDAGALAAVPAQARGSTPLGAVSTAVGPLVPLRADLRGDALVSVMLDRPAPFYLVREDDGSALGVINTARVQQHLRGR